MEWMSSTYWEELIDEPELVIRNDDQLTHNWMRQHSMGESVIDRTLGNRPFKKWMILDGRHPTGSDDENIEWELGVEKPEEAGGTQVVGWNLAAISQEDVEMAEELWTK
jgi:hypothetical protein